jgi:Lrp/AsnC family leucine-responsive transcriptional regulator
MINDIDQQILTILQEDARASNTEIARQVGMAPSAIFERVRKLEARGLIKGYEARLNAERLGLGLLAFVFVRVEEPLDAREAEAQLVAIPEVQEVHLVAGEDCYLVKVRVSGTAALTRLLKERLGAISSIRSTRTTIVLETCKETARLPVGAAQEEDNGKD